MTETSNTPYIENPPKYTEEPYPPVGFRIFSPEGIGERPNLKKSDLKVDEPVAVAATAPVTEDEKPKKRATRKATTVESESKPAGAGAGDKTSKKGN